MRQRAATKPSLGADLTGPTTRRTSVEIGREMAKCRQIRDQLTTAANVAERKTDTRPGIAKTLERDVPKGHRTGGTRNRTGNETVPLTGETETDAGTILRTDTKTGTTGATGDEGEEATLEVAVSVARASLKKASTLNQISTFSNKVKSLPVLSLFCQALLQPSPQ